MKAQQLWFENPRRLEIRSVDLAPLRADHVLVRNQYSAVSSGTELLAYRGLLPDTEAGEASLDAYGARDSAYPLQYGYASVGEVIETGTDVDKDWLGKAVFSFQPHASLQQCGPEALIPVPENIAAKSALFLANMETAVNLVQDANPTLGERVVVIGQGVVGLLTTGLLARFPLAGLIAIDPDSNRRSWSKQEGARQAFETGSEEATSELQRVSQTGGSDHRGGADLALELSGSPAALNLAIELCGYGGRIIVGSWYGKKGGELNLGDRFHRRRITLQSSQVSTIAPGLRGRWNKQRRFTLAWDMIESCQPERFISHCLPLSEADRAYRLLDEAAEDVLQVVFQYDD